MKKLFTIFFLLMVGILGGSWFFSNLWGMKTEKEPQKIELSVETKSASVKVAHEDKNWIKIAPKLGLWALFLAYMFSLIKKGRLTKQNRAWHYLFAIVLFGIIFGSDPSPMGTIKDAIVLLAKSGSVFPPRLIALTAMLLTVILANKSICAWGCQIGTLQDLLFRLNKKSATAPIFKQYKLPFVISNSVRIVFFITFVAIAIGFSLDIIESIDPFKIYLPQKLTSLGLGFSLVLLSSSLTVYRPWCHLFCPFGLFGWILEKLSWYKIRVNRKTCINCRACEKACPNESMLGILDSKKVVSDCFACGSCIEVCPTKSVAFRKKEKE